MVKKNKYQVFLILILNMISNHKSENLMEDLAKKLQLYVITDSKLIDNIGIPIANAVEEAILGGATIIQLREKNISFDEYLQKALVVKQITDKYGIPLIINDNTDVAVACDADGVHLGQDDESIQIAKQKLKPDKIIGISANTLQEAIDAEKSGASYLGIDTPFSTQTKRDAKFSTLENMIKICSSVKIPCVAIGGINKNNITDILKTGIAGTAVISSIFGDKNVKKNTLLLKQKIEIGLEKK